MFFREVNSIALVRFTLLNKPKPFPVFPGHATHVGSNAASAFPSWPLLHSGAGAGKGWCAGCPPLPWPLKDVSEEDAALQPAHRRRILGMPNAAAIPSTP